MNQQNRPQKRVNDMTVEIRNEFINANFLVIRLR
jgi:hypothetical protein